jgi:hypothetical protein
VARLSESESVIGTSLSSTESVPSFFPFVFGPLLGCPDSAEPAESAIASPPAAGERATDTFSLRTHQPP